MFHVWNLLRLHTAIAAFVKDTGRRSSQVNLSPRNLRHTLSPADLPVPWFGRDTERPPVPPAAVTCAVSPPPLEHDPRPPWFPRLHYGALYLSSSCLSFSLESGYRLLTRMTACNTYIPSSIRSIRTTPQHGRYHFRVALTQLGATGW